MKAMQNDPLSIFCHDWKVQFQPPSSSIYEFSGSFQWPNEEEEENLNVLNVLWTNMTIATNDAYLLIMYIGCDTRAALNT